MKKFFTLFLSILAVNIAWADDEETATTFYDEASGLYFTIDGKNAEITYSDDEGDSSYPDLSGELTIPETVSYDNTEYTVTSIGSKAFYKCEITSVNIPETVTNIGNYAFAYTSLTSIYIPKSVETIEWYAFGYCYYAEKIIFDPDSKVEFVVDPNNNYAQSYCFRKAGTEAESPLSVEFSKGMGSLEKGLFFDAVIGSMKFDYKIAGTEICEYAFQIDSSTPIVKTVELPEGIEKIGTRAFWGEYTIETLVLPSTLNEIDAGGLSLNSSSVISKFYCKAENPPTVNSGDMGNGIYFDTANPTLYVPSSSVEAYKADTAWSNHFKEVKSFDFPDFKIDGIYYKITDETNNYVEIVAGPVEYEGEVTIPETVTFEEVEYSVTRVGSSAFYGCNGLESIEIGKNVEEIGVSAFDRCRFLKTVKFAEDGNLKTLHRFAFNRDSSLVDITLPAGIDSLGRWSFHMCDLLQSADLSQTSITNVARLLFEGCPRFTEVKLPETTEIISAGSFIKAPLESITIPEKVTKIEEFAFAGCSYLKYVECEATTPPVLGDSVFMVGTSDDCGYKYNWESYSNDNYSDFYLTGEYEPLGGTLVVPTGYKYIYEESDWTQYFDTIESEAIEDEDGNAYYFRYANKEKTEIVAELFEISAEAKTISDKVTINEIEYDVTFADTVICNATTPPTLEVTLEYEEAPILSVLDGYKRIYEGTESWFLYFTIEGDPIEIDGVYYYYLSDTELEVAANPEKYSDVVTIPAEVDGYTVTTIGTGAFTDCTDLKSLIMESETPLTVNDGAFDKNPEIAYTIWVPKKTKSTYVDAGWGDYVVDKDDNIQEIPDYYIDGIYYNIVEVEVEEYGLKASTISLEVTNGPEAYEGDITIPESRTIDLGDGTTVVYDVTSINSSAFKDCANLTSITIESSTPLENADALNQVPETCVIVVPNQETKSAYQDILTNVTIYTEEEYKELIDGIEIKTIEREEIERYNLLGQKIANPQKGINIIKYSDGTVEKVLVK